MVQTYAIKLFHLTIAACLVMLMLSGTAFAGEWSVDNSTGVKVWNPQPAPNETVTWSGGSEDGYAEGCGELKWFINGTLVQRGQGAMKQGKMQGRWKIEFLRRGVVYDGNYLENRRHGQGTLIFVNGGVWQGQWVDGKYQPFAGRIQSLEQNQWQVHDVMTHPFGMYVLISQPVTLKPVDNPAKPDLQPGLQGVYLLSVAADGQDQWIKKLDMLYLTGGLRGSLQAEPGKLLVVVAGQQSAGGRTETLLYSYDRHSDELKIKGLPVPDAGYLHFAGNGIRYFDRAGQQLVHLDLTNYQIRLVRKLNEQEVASLQDQFQDRHSGGLWPVTQTL